MAMDGVSDLVRQSGPAQPVKPRAAAQPRLAASTEMLTGAAPELAAREAPPRPAAITDDASRIERERQ
jgi:hypothetical protein